MIFDIIFSCYRIFLNQFRYDTEVARDGDDL
jgi:hypothetical protein